MTNITDSPIDGVEFLYAPLSQAKHVWIMLGVLLAWAIEQVAWVHSRSSHRACYRAFDVRSPTSLLTAVVGAGVVAAVAFGESFLEDAP